MANILDALRHLGRYGDSEIRPVDGEPAHVNDNEAAALDSLGKLAEPMVKNQGAGTTNPRTGLKEYHWGKNPAHWGDHTLGRVEGGMGHKDDINPYSGAWEGQDKRITTYDDLINLYASGKQYDYIGDVWFGKRDKGKDIRDKIDTYIGDFLDPNRVWEMKAIEDQHTFDMEELERLSGLAYEDLDTNVRLGRNSILQAFSKNYPTLKEGSNQGQELGVTDVLNSNKRRLLRETNYAFDERRRKYKQTKDRLDRDYDFKSRKATFKKDVATRKQGDEYLKEFYLGIADIT